MYAEFTQFNKMLNTLSRLLDKAQRHAEANNLGPKVLLNARLAPDMLPLTSQVQMVCDTAMLASSVLTGKSAPTFNKDASTFSELKDLIEKTVTYVSSMQESDFLGWEDRVVAPPGWSGAFLGKDYFHQHALPNFYFHMVTAYAILRHAGVRIGKMDYIGKLPFLI